MNHPFEKVIDFSLPPLEKFHHGTRQEHDQPVSDQPANHRQNERMGYEMPFTPKNAISEELFTGTDVE
jgi:hypothetical protein